MPKVTNYVANKIKKYYTEKYINEKKVASKNSKLVSIYKKLIGNDVIHKIINNLAQRATSKFKENKVERTLTHMQLIGCSVEKLKSHLEKQFDKNVSFKNYGKWELDHIKPISKFYLSDEKELLRCFNYKNLQPLWKFDNKSKGAKYESDSE